MSTGRNKALARHEILEFENAGNTAVADELLAGNYQLHFPGFPPLDREGHKQVIAAFRTAFPDLKLEVETQIAEGDRVANHIRMTGAHRGEFQGIPPTGKRVEVTFSNVMTFRNDKIVEIWGYLDAVSLMQQLGVIPA